MIAPYLCSTQNCGRPARARGYCNRCYKRARVSGGLPLLPVLYGSSKEGKKLCKVMWGIEHKEELRKYRNRYAATTKGKYVNLKKAAKKRGLPVTLTLAEYAALIEAQCHYCGGELPKSGGGLDRIDNNQGYALTNCLPCCARCNRMRGEYLSVEEMEAASLGVKLLKEGHNMTYFFNKQKGLGAMGERIFFEAHKDFLEKAPNLRCDFVLTGSGEGVELKTDFYDPTETPNFFFERWSHLEQKKPGGPWQALANGSKYFVYLFVPTLTYYKFETAQLVERLDNILHEYFPKNVSNKAYTTQGYCIPREAMADLYKETQLNVSVSGGNFT